jgi:hypothetical protein
LPQPSVRILATDFQGQVEQAVQIEVDVGHRRKQRFRQESADRLVGLAQAPGVMRVSGHAFQAVQDQLLHRLHVGAFAADDYGTDAADAASGLFALIAEHRKISIDRGSVTRMAGSSRAGLPWRLARMERIIGGSRRRRFDL